MKKGRVGIWIFEILMLGIALIWLYPYIWLLLSSFKPQNEIYTTIIPSSLTLEHYEFIFSSAEKMERPFLRALGNSLFISVVVTFSVIVTSAFVGYAIAKIKFRGGRFLNHFTIFQMLFPGFMFILPLYIVIKNLGMYNSLAGLIVPSLFGAWGAFMFAQSLRALPDAYIESARIEGASEWKIIMKIMFPLVRSTASIVGLFTFIGIWDNFLWPLIVIQDYEKMPLSVLLASFNHEYASYIGPLLAGSVIQTIPMVLLFLIFRKYFLKGISVSLK